MKGGELRGRAGGHGVQPPIAGEAQSPLPAGVEGDLAATAAAAAAPRSKIGCPAGSADDPADGQSLRQHDLRGRNVRTCVSNLRDMFCVQPLFGIAAACLLRTQPGLPRGGCSRRPRLPAATPPRSSAIIQGFFVNIRILNHHGVEFHETLKPQAASCDAACRPCRKSAIGDVRSCKTACTGRR